MSETPGQSGELADIPKDLLEVRDRLLSRAEERLTNPAGPASAEVAAVEKRVADDPKELARYAAELIKLRKAAAAHQAAAPMPFIPGALAAMAHIMRGRRPTDK